MIVYNKVGESQQLGELFAKGGEGEIYPVRGRPNILVKKYFDKKLNKDGKILVDKILAMKDVREKYQFKNKNIGWVAIPVYADNQQRRFIGYAMPKMKGVPFRTLAHAKLYAKHAPNLNRLEIVKMMLSWLGIIESLHQKNIMIGDYNLQNFLWDPKTLQISFIDCDSYQMRIADKFFPCLVGSADLTAPEHHNKDFKDIERTPESEYFSIAIILFMCLMLGRHPFDIVGGSDPVSNMQKGNFPYGANKGHLIPKGDWYKIWSHMSFDLKSLFIKTFTEGAKDPKKRVNIDTWKKVLNKYMNEMIEGYHDVKIRPDKPKIALSKPKSKVKTKP